MVHERHRKVVNASHCTMGVHEKESLEEAPAVDKERHFKGKDELPAGEHLVAGEQFRSVEGEVADDTKGEHEGI